jgi:pantoate kinase
MKLQGTSSIRSVESFSPGSATLFFIPNKSKDIERKGSRGVALCLETGMKTRIVPGKEIEVRFNGIPIDNSIQEEIATRLGFRGKIFSSSELPPSSGFGLSAAAALTTASAILGSDSRVGEIYRLAHELEIRRGTGLGDVQSQINGGFHIRIKGGSFPYSVTERILEKQTEIAILPFKKKTPTGEIIRSKSNLEEIVRNGDKAFDLFLKKPTLHRAFVLGRKFAEDSGLLSPKASKILDDLNGKFASVSLIGDSIIAIYDEETMNILKKYGDPIKTRISATGLNLS